MTDRAKLYYYKRNPSDALAGMARLTLEQRGAYNTLLDLMYQNGGALDHDERFLMHQLGCSLRKCKALISELLERGKIYLTDDGKIGNERVDQEVGKASSARDRGNSDEKQCPKTPRKHSENELKTSRKSAENSGNANEFNKNEPENELYARALQLESIVIVRDKEDVSNETSIGARGEIGGDLFGGGEPKAAPAKVKVTRSKRAKLSTDYTPEFLEFWAAYPKNSLMPKAKAFEQFSELTPEDRRLAIVAAPLYAAQVARLRTPEDKIKRAHNWLAERYFDALTDPELMAATEQRALAVATPGNGRATMADKMAILAELVEREENGQR